MKKITTASGFETEISEDALDDFELLEWLYEIDDKNFRHLRDILKHLLGEGESTRLIEFLRGENGRVTTTAIAAALFDIVSAAGKK